MTNFRLVDCETKYLFPPSVDEWLLDDHRSRFVVEITDQLDIPAIQRQYTACALEDQLSEEVAELAGPSRTARCPAGRSRIFAGRAIPPWGPILQIERKSMMIKKEYIPNPRLVKIISKILEMVSPKDSHRKTKKF